MPALVLADSGTHPWAQWAGTGALLITLLVIVVVAFYLLVPAQQVLTSLSRFGSIGPPHGAGQ